MLYRIVDLFNFASIQKKSSFDYPFVLFLLARCLKDCSMSQTSIEEGIYNMMRYTDDFLTNYTLYTLF